MCMHISIYPCAYMLSLHKSCSPSIAGRTLCVGNREGVVSIWCAKVSHNRPRRSIQISWLAAFAIGWLLLHFQLPVEGVLYNLFIKNGNWLMMESEKVKIGRDLLWLLTRWMLSSCIDGNCSWHGSAELPAPKPGNDFQSVHWVPLCCLYVQTYTKWHWSMGLYKLAIPGTQINPNYPIMYGQVKVLGLTIQ